MKTTFDKWGFRPENSVTIEPEKGSYEFYNKLVRKIPGLQSCIFCGGCHATCTAQKEGMNFRKMHLLLRRGVVHPLGQLVAPCVLCGKCMLVCPRNVDTRSVIYNLKIMLHESV